MNITDLSKISTNSSLGITHSYQNQVGDFKSMLNNALDANNKNTTIPMTNNDNTGSFFADIRQAEQISIANLNGDSDSTELVSAITKAEISLATMTTIRDKAISAYNDITKMPI